MGERLTQRMQRMRAEKTTKSQRRLLDFFERADAKKLLRCSITEIARELDIADATVLRFCRALGFEGYRDFRMALAAESFTAEPEGRLAALSERFEERARVCAARFQDGEIEAAANLIKQARTVCCLGMGASFCAAMAMHERLLALGVASFCERDGALCELFLASRGIPDVLLLFGADVHAEHDLALARARGMRTISVAGEERLRCDLALAVCPEKDRMAEFFAVEALGLALDRLLREVS